jgi:hypothetical protein
VNDVLSEFIALQCSTRQVCPLALFLYVITVDALGYLLEVARMQGKISGYLLTIW